MFAELKGKVAVVTGGGAGIGLACAARLAEAGVAVGVADIDSAAADQAAADLTSQGHRCVAIVTDVSRPKRLKSCFK